MPRWSVQMSSVELYSEILHRFLPASCDYDHGDSCLSMGDAVTWKIGWQSARSLQSSSNWNGEGIPISKCTSTLPP